MNKIKLTFFIIFLSVFTCVPGQAVPDSTGISLGYPVYSQYLQNGLMINPAYTGSRGALSTFLSYRMQWMGTKGSPVIQSVSLHTPMKNDKVALGIMAQFMQFGFTKSTSIYANYAYHIRVGKGKLSLSCSCVEFQYLFKTIKPLFLKTCPLPPLSGSEVNFSR